MSITCYFPQEETGGLLVEVYPLLNEYRDFYNKHPLPPNSQNFHYYGEGDFYNRPGGGIFATLVIIGTCTLYIIIST
jgi:hypothetical protein